jgi:hypothetical protein
MGGKMASNDGNLLRDIGVGLYATIFYALYFWRVFKKNPGNRVVECGVITLVVFLAMIPLIKLHDPPDWVFVVWLILVVLLCFSTLFFVVQCGYRAMVRHKHASAKS